MIHLDIFPYFFVIDEFLQSTKNKLTIEEFQLNGLTGIVPIIIKYSGRTYAAKVTIKCELTTQEYDKWRIATYNSISF